MKIAEIVLYKDWELIKVDEDLYITSMHDTYYTVIGYTQTHGRRVRKILRLLKTYTIDEKKI